MLGCCAILFSACTQSSTTQAQAQNVVATASPALHAFVQRPIVRHVHADAAVKHVAQKTAVPMRYPILSATTHTIVAAVPVVKLPTVVATPNGIVLSAPHALPRIVRIELAQRSVTSGEVVHASVYTTSNTASVEARIYSYSMPLQRVGVGHFRFVYRVPDVPFYLKRDWPVQVIAHNVDGRSTSKEVTISIQ